MSFRADDLVYVDESKARGYILAATASDSATVAASDRALRSLLKPGQRRIHFKSESDPRRRLILSRMEELDVKCTVWKASGVADRVARPLLLGALVERALDIGIAGLVIERDESLEQTDRRVIAALVRVSGSHMRYLHAAPHEHPLLWVSDAVAWCTAHGGDWARRVKPLVEGRVFEGDKT